MYQIIIFIPLLAFLFYILYSRTKFKNKRGLQHAFFFENDCLVLNMMAPYAIPFSEIEYVELTYSSKEIQSRLSYNLSIKVMRKNGKAKSVFYKGAKTSILPSDMQKELEAKGLRCIMVDKK